MKKTTIAKAKKETTVKTKVQNVKKSPLKNIKWLTELSKTAFLYLAGINRPVNPSHVTKQVKSISMLGCVQPVVVTEIDFINGKKGFYIIDGQHKFNALLRLGEEIPYVVIDLKNKEELVEAIALLNASSKSWTIQDYVTAWSSLREDYVKLNRYFQIYDFELSVLAQILNNQTVRAGLGSNSSTNKIKNGTFKINDEEKAVEILNNLTDVLNILPRANRSEIRYACSEYINFFVNSGLKYNHQKFLAQLDKNKEVLMFSVQEEGKLVDFFRSIAK